MKSKLAVVFICAVAISGCEKARLDAEIKRLCAKDGGIKIYETVSLPSTRFNEWGQVDFFRPSLGENALGLDYLFKFERQLYAKGNPEMSRTHYQVIRRADGKLLGETVLYARGGGDVPSPMHDSSFHCPEVREAGSNALLMKIFTKVSGGEK